MVWMGVGEGREGRDMAYQENEAQAECTQHVLCAAPVTPVASRHSFPLQVPLNLLLH